MNFIQSPVDTGEAAVLFQKEIRWAQTPQRVEAKATAIGVYNLLINGQKVGEQVLTPGWTSYTHRLLVRGHRVENIAVSTVRVTADAAQIEPLLVAPIVAMPILLALLISLLIPKKKRYRGGENDFYP